MNTLSRACRILVGVVCGAAVACLAGADWPLDTDNDLLTTLNSSFACAAISDEDLNNVRIGVANVVDGNTVRVWTGLNNATAENYLSTDIDLSPVAEENLKFDDLALAVRTYATLPHKIWLAIAYTEVNLPPPSVPPCYAGSFPAYAIYELTVNQNSIVSTRVDNAWSFPQLSLPAASGRTRVLYTSQNIDLDEDNGWVGLGIGTNVKVVCPECECCDDQGVKTTRFQTFFFSASRNVDSQQNKLGQWRPSRVNSAADSCGEADGWWVECSAPQYVYVTPGVSIDTQPNGDNRGLLSYDIAEVDIDSCDESGVLADHFFFLNFQQVLISRNQVWEPFPDNHESPPAHTDGVLLRDNAPNFVKMFAGGSIIECSLSAQTPWTPINNNPGFGPGMSDPTMTILRATSGQNVRYVRLYTVDNHPENEIWCHISNGSTTWGGSANLITGWSNPEFVQYGAVWAFPVIGRPLSSGGAPIAFIHVDDPTMFPPIEGVYRMTQTYSIP